MYTTRVSCYGVRFLTEIGRGDFKLLVCYEAFSTVLYMLNVFPYIVLIFRWGDDIWSTTYPPIKEYEY